MKQYKNFINGEWVAAVSGDTFTNLNPADTREAVTEYALGGRAEALAFTNKVGALAKEIFHHPDIFLVWGKVKITIWTHKIDGLNEADFIFAAKADALLS